MKFKIALIAALAVGLMTSLAVAAPARGPKGKTGTTNTTTTAKVEKAKTVCRPNVSLILRGKLVSVASDQLSFTMDVKQTNRHAKALYKGKTVTVQVNEKTKIRRLGKLVTLSALTIGDRLDVRARLCKVKKGTVATDVAPPLAVRVVAKPAKPAPTTTTND
jgi:hypothetical protein